MKCILTIVFLAAGSCATAPEPEPVTPNHVPAATCKSACDNGTFLGCEWAIAVTPGEDGVLGTGDDADCEKRCAYYRSPGVNTPFDVDCLTAVPSCAASDLCAEGAQ